MAASVIGALKISLQAETAQFFRHLRRTRGDLHKTGQAGVASGAALGALTAALGGIAVAAGRASMALNRGMANVATLIPGNTERVTALKTAVQGLAAAHGKSSQDLAAGLYQTISAFGDSAGRTMRILEINSRAATAGVATVAEAVDLTSAVTKAYGDTSAEAVQKVSDLALLTVRLGKTDFPSLAAAIGRTAPLAAALGVRQEELAASYATVAGVTGSTAEASTQLRAIMSALVSSTPALEAAIEDLGAADAQTLIETHGLQGALAALIAETDGSVAAVSELIGRDEAVAAALHLAAEGAQVFATNLQEMEEAAGTTDEAYDAFIGGLNKSGQAWLELSAMLQRGREELGDRLMPILARAAEGLRPLWDGVMALVRGLGALPQPLQTVVVGAGGLLVPLALIKSLTGGLTLAFLPLLGQLADVGAQFRAALTGTNKAAAGFRGVAPAAGAASVGLRGLGMAVQALGMAVRKLLISTVVVGVLVALTAALVAGAAALWRFWKASRDPEARLAKLRDRSAEVADRIARLEVANKRVSPRLRATQQRVEWQKRAMEQAAAETKRLELAQSDLGKTLTALAARDMAAWARAGEEARQQAAALAGDLPETEQRMAQLALAVREFGAAGKLTPAVLRQIGEQARALGPATEDLPPELRNIVVWLERLEAPADNVATALDRTGASADEVDRAFAALVQAEVKAIEKADLHARVRKTALKALGRTEGAADETTQSLRELVEAEIAAMRESERHAEARRIATVELLAERGIIHDIVGGLSDPPPPPPLPSFRQLVALEVEALRTAEERARVHAAAAAILDAQRGIIRDIVGGLSEGPPPPPPSWIGQAQEIGARWGATFARAFEGGGNWSGAFRSIFVTETQAPLGDALGQLSQKIGGWAKGLSSGLGSALGGMLSAGLGAVIPIVGPLLGSLAGKLWGGLKRVFGGPSEAEVAARDSFESLRQAAVDALGRIPEYSAEVAALMAQGWDRRLAQTSAAFTTWAAQAGVAYEEARRLYGQYQTAVQQPHGGQPDRAGLRRAAGRADHPHGDRRPARLRPPTGSAGAPVLGELQPPDAEAVGAADQIPQFDGRGAPRRRERRGRLAQVVAQRVVEGLLCRRLHGHSSSPAAARARRAACIASPASAPRPARSRSAHAARSSASAAARSSAA